MTGIHGLVSVIIPTHNRAALLPRAIRSVLEQTYPHLECIVVDDASTDDTPDVLRRLDDQRLVYLRHEVNRGASAARNTGIARAKGKLVAFLDDDDEWLPTKLEKQVSLLESSPSQVGMVYCWMDYYDGQGFLVREYRPSLRGSVFEHVLDAQRLGGCPTLLVRGEVVEEIGGFDEELPRGNDGDFIRRVCLRYEVDYVPEMLVRVYVEHGHKRISLDDDTGIRQRIIAKEARISTFREHYEQHRPQLARALSELALCHMALRERRTAISIFCKAFVAYPFSGVVLRNAVKGLFLGLGVGRRA